MRTNHVTITTDKLADVHIYIKYLQIKNSVQIRWYESNTTPNTTIHCITDITKSTNSFSNYSVPSYLSFPSKQTLRLARWTINSTLISTYFLRLPTAFLWNPTNITPEEETAALQHHYSWHTQLCHSPIFQHCVSLLMYFPFFVFKHHRSGAMTFTLPDRFAPYPHKYQEYLLPSFFLLSTAQSFRLFPTLDIVL